LATAPESRLDRIRRAFGGEDAFKNLVDQAVDLASQMARDSREPVAGRVESIHMLRLAPPQQFAAMLPEFLSLHSPPEIRSAALSSAEYFSGGEIGAAILSELETMTPSLRAQACQVVLGRSDWTNALIDRLSDGRIPAVLLDAPTRQQLARHASAAIRERATSVLGTAPNADRAAVVNEYASQLGSLTGDTARGRATFVKSCAVCHRLEDEGNDVGPTLVASAQRGAEALLQNILDPNREVDARYLAFVVELSDGRTATGVIASETATSLTLRTADGQTLTVGRDEVDSLRSSTLSLMPENFENEITPQAMADLIAYLLSQRE
jgi:putative heme-binding domain-containing protein